MYPCFDIDGISLDRLLWDWKWLVSDDLSLLAVSAFGDLFLENVSGRVYRLDVTSGTISAIAASNTEFREATKDPERMKDWLLEDLAAQAQQKGCTPGKGQCVGYKIPCVFEESANVPNNIYVADLYEYVSFMGDIHRQISSIPDGGQVRMKIQPSSERA